MLAGYMAGLALGGLIALGPLGRNRPRAWYIGLELWIALSGAALVLAAPGLAPLLATQPALSASLLVLLSLLLPTTAMGWVLPLLSACALPEREHFRREFGWLYAANAAGAVAGSLLAVASIRGLGMPAAVLLAVGGNLLAVLAVWPVRSGVPADSLPAGAILPAGSWRLVWATTLAGALMLGLEVLWFRAILLNVRGTDWQFAVLVAVVIAGISLGALCWSRLTLSRWAVLAGLSNLLAYLLFESWSRLPVVAHSGALQALLLAGPCAVASGALFAGIAAQLRGAGMSSARTTGVLYASNALGAAAGALLMIYVLLPQWGLASAWVAALGTYALVAALLLRSRGEAWAAAALAGGALLLPDLSPRWFAPAVAQFEDYELVARREAPDASLQLAVRRWAGEPVAYRLITDGFSMSGSERDSLRYMRMFAHLPQALHPQLESALLISYGLGNTAAAMLSDPGLNQLLVVDTSVATLELAGLMHAQAARPDPLLDPRVTLRIDDGRHVLLRSGQGFDLISAEPPPPRLAGVVNLYTQEYFALVRQRLNPGGMTTHWLPVDQLSMPSAAAIIRGFCRVFPDCSLWAGSHYNWILLGWKQPSAVLSPGQTQGLWAQSASARSLIEIGLERPGQLLSTYLADARQLAQWLGPGEALRDDFPGRLESRPVSEAELTAYFEFMDDRASERRFEESAWVAAVWPAALQSQARADWFWQPILNGQVRLAPDAMAQVSAAALRQGLTAPVLFLAGISARELQVGAAQIGPDWAWARGLEALVARDWARAERELRQSSEAAAPGLRQVARCFASGECGD